MFRFFRKIRNKASLKNNTRKYFFYAIGEVLLVIIGILLALQINNWNESNKEKALEYKLIDALITDLNLKKSEAETDLSYGPEQIEALDEIIRAWELNGTLDTTLDIPYALRLLGMDKVFFNINSPAYLGLSSSNLWKVLPDSLTRKIDSIYRISFNQVKIRFEKIREYGTYCRLNFLIPNNLNEFSGDTKSAIGLLNGKEDELVSFIKQLKSNILSIGNAYKNVLKKIDEVKINLKTYKDSQI